MEFGLCELAIVPLRQGLSDRSEMISQILFGEIFEIIAKRGDWLRVKMPQDNYEGWVQKDSISLITEADYYRFQNNKKIFFEDLQIILVKNGKEKILVPIGSAFPGFSEQESIFTINGNTYGFEKALSPEKVTVDKREMIIKVAKKFLNTSYIWGGRTAWGIDCSGFSQLLYKIVGVELPRDASQQVHVGNTVNFITDAKPGDLVFFDDDDGNIIHVGIFMDNGKIIHASKKVRIDIVDHQGIYNREIKRYTHNLRVIKSI
jgi:gamma-D-glutamyl-L-lysine dipeptidyl-peptidase